jgi:long-chain acyl-CoA synthetase
MIEGYGLSETSPVAIVVPVNNKSFIGKVGLPVSSTMVEIIDSTESSLAYGELGEIVIKGPQVMKEYWRNNLETKNVFTRNGFLKTGDLGVMDKDGFVTVIDRKKDMILVSGFNVYPTEVEEVVSMHPSVSECAVIGVPSELTGEMVKLFIVSHKNKPLKEEINKLCRKNLAAYKCPKEIVFIKDLPKSNVGKILKRELRLN